MVFTKLFFESILFAVRSLVANRLRTLLSLFGVVIGIFVIILILTSLDSLKKDINDSISSLGDDIIYIHKWPWEGGFDYPWWKYWQRPVPTIKEMEQVEKNAHLAEYVSFSVSANRSLKYKSNSVPSAEINGVFVNYDKLYDIEIEEGRFFTESELRSSRNLVIIGSGIAEGLMGNQSPVGKRIKISNNNYTVIGVMPKKGASLFGNGADNKVYIPYYNIRNLVDLNSWRVHREILVKARPGVTNEQLKDELTGLMRSIRKLKPTEEDDFTLNEASMIAKQMSNITIIFDIVAWAIGLLAVLVGTFGIANIMFVSVKERTNIIGIQKALGAQRRFILMQFLAEALILTMVGGLLGLLIVFGVTKVVSAISSFNMVLSVGNVARGMWISTLIGVLSGIIPAWLAARMSPVDAIRSK